MSMRLTKGTRAPNKAATATEAKSREARLVIDRDTVTLLVEGALEAVTARVDLDTVRPDRWAGDGSASFAQAQGRQLWSRLFAGAVGLALEEAVADAAAAGQTLTLRVARGTDTPDDRWWQPFEVLFGELTAGFAALAPGWSIVRAEPLGAGRTLPAGRPLRVLVIPLLYLDTSPPSWKVNYAQVEEEIASLSALSERDERVDIEVVADPDRAGLIELLGDPRYDVIHVIGTGFDGGLGVRDPSSGVPYPPEATTAASVGQSASGGLASEYGSGANVLTGQEFLELMVQNTEPALVVLNGCDLERVAEALAPAGVVVLAHRGVVADPHAAALPEAFYSALLEGNPAHVALTAARLKLEQKFPGQMAWAATTLFTGWPPPAFTPPATESDRRRSALVGAETLSGDDPISVAQLKVQIHALNLQKLETLDVQTWEPVAAQRALADHVQPA